jgi:hypothetical protein
LAGFLVVDQQEEEQQQRCHAILAAKRLIEQKRYSFSKSKAFEVSGLFNAVFHVVASCIAINK